MLASRIPRSPHSTCEANVERWHTLLNLWASNVWHPFENQAMAVLLSDSDLVAIGGLSTLILAAIAVWQMNHSRRQTTALEGQVEVMRKTAEDELKVLQRQVEASVAQSQAVSDAARAQLQPIVFAYDVRPGRVEYSGRIGFCYRLTNEGTGVALNLRHGVEIGSFYHEFGGEKPHEIGALRAGEGLPSPTDPDTLAEMEDMGEKLFWWWPSTQERVDGYVLTVRHDKLPSGSVDKQLIHWVRFENVFGERFETRNPADPSQSPTFRRIEEERHDTRQEARA
jgi:cell division protein FtsL